jgi:hypothetical protein
VPTTDVRHDQRRPPADALARSWRAPFRTVWAATLTGLLGLVFVGLTAVALWATDPTYT